jgi:peptidyl-prolyl cis-trans isomerase D
MLQQIRDKISGWFAAVFLGAIAVVFIFWGIQFESTVTTAAAKVNGEDVPVEAVRRAWQERQTELQRLTRDELPGELVKSEQQRLLSEFITRELMVQRANKLGYHVSDREIVNALGQIEALQVNGKFDPDRYKALLRSQGRSEVEFEREFRRDLDCGRRRLGGGVLLIDDVITTGATLDACARVLLSAGADTVFALTFARED